MPLYEYECVACHRRTEKIQKFSDPDLTECPHCGSHLERTLTAPAIQFKGSGWYKDLYSSAKPANASPAAAGESGSPSSGGGEAAGPAPAAKTEASPSPSSAPAAASGPASK